MKNVTLALSFFVFSATVLAQNLLVSTVNPTGLYVCGTSQMTVTIQNGAGPAAANLITSVTFPSGITYVPGTVSGATENNITNLNAPVFALPDLAGGSTVSFTLFVTAGCAVVQAINDGLTFSNTIVANYTGGSKQAISPFYPVETGLLNIGSITPPTTTAQKGDVVMRMITMKNTRQGPIESISFRDQYNTTGLSIQLVGGVNQSNLPTLFTAEIPGSYFSTVGNGDTLLDFNEEITLIEKVTIEDCGIPSITPVSLIIIGWGCGGPACRTDSISAEIKIIGTTQNPNLSFQPVYAAPTSQCGMVPASQEILIINNGQLPATDILMNPFTIDTGYMALDQTSFEWNNGTGWQTLPPQVSNPTVLGSCSNADYSVDVIVSIPEVLPGDTVRLRYNTYYCEPICGGLIPRMRVVYRYLKACPPTSATSGVFNFFPDTAFLKITASVEYDLENCLQDDSTYNLNYWIKSGRLLKDTGYLQVIFDLPLGFDWGPCPLELDGQTPLETEITADTVTGSTTVRMVFDLPFSQDSVGDDLCLTYHCEQNLPCLAEIGNVPPRGLDYTVISPPSDCGGCQLKLHTYSLVSTTPDEAINCAITFCDEFILVVDDHCDTTGGGGGGGGGGGLGGGDGNIVVVDFNSYRTNYGYEDNDDDRSADNTNPAKHPDVRRDRFLVGDTLRTELKVFLAQGSLSELNFRVFFESWQSDFDTLDGDAYMLAMGKKLFANYDTTSFVSAHLTIKTAGGDQYDCPIGLPGIKSDQHIIQVAEPNIRPPQIIDVLTNMFHQFDLDFAQLNCVPAGFELGAGDSLIFTSDFKFEYNFTPDGANAPPLINFRNSVCDTDKTFSWKLENFCTEKEICQYSGYLESVNPEAQIINPCAQSTEVSPFQYHMVIARPNMFPFEVRPLSSVTKYTYSLPTSVDLLDTKLDFIRLQDNVLKFDTTTLTPGFGGDSLTVDLDPFFANPLDEGYSFEISTRFDTTCGYNGDMFGRTVLGMKYANMCFHNPVEQTYYIVNPNGYQSGSPELNFFSPTNVLYLPTNEVLLNFFLRNNAPVEASNAWMTIESDGDLADVQLLLMPGQTPVPLVGGVYQLGNMGSFAQPAFRLTARNLSCRPVTVTFRFGWDCTPVFNANGDACGIFSKTIELRPQPPELELTIEPQPSPIPMCEPSDYFEFVISNALDGTAYDILPSIKLPPGMRIQPNSSQLSYPDGGVFLDMPNNPVQLPGNVWQFIPGQPLQNGLLSADEYPLNTMRIRFKIIAECGVVANSQPIYGAESVQACGINSNILRRPGLPINIEGIEPSYTATPILEFSVLPGSAGCGQEVALTATIGLSDVPMAGDSIYILLPAGTSYVDGSYEAVSNAPSGPPQQSGQQLQLPLPASVGANTILKFTFSISYDDPADCADKFVILQTREKTEAFCPSNNQLCDVYVATGEYLLNINAQNPELQLNNFELNTQGTQTTFSATLENAGTTTSTNPVVELYHDQNGNGQIDATDPLVATVTQNGVLPAGGVMPISGDLSSLPASAFCNLIALIPADQNCACADHIFPLDGHQIVTKGIGLCTLQPVNVGTDSIAGNTYTWLSPLGLSCTNCPNAVYTPGPDVLPGELVTLVLQEKSGTCTIERRFEIQFGGSFGIESTDQTICEGEPVTLEATAGGVSYHWAGTGITNPALQTQVLQPVSNSTYSVIVTFAGGCADTGAVQVTVIPAFRKQEPTITICEGQSVVILGQSRSVAGIYTLELQQINGCDSIYTQELKVEPTSIAQTAVFCPGGSVQVFDSTFTTSGILCQTVQSSAGCLVTTCVTVKQTANPQVPEQDSALVIALGEGVIIETPNDYSTYEWTPYDPDVLTCSDCPDPTATPDKSTTFLLIVTDGNGCRDSAEYRVFVCDDKLIHIPNAFTPNGDGSNDVFRVVPHEGADVVLSLQIYDRWGQKVYEGSGPNAQWDGKIRDKPAPSDVYVWIIDIECGGLRIHRSRDVTLLR